MIPPADHPREADRLDLLRRCGVLDTAAEPDFDGLAALAAEIAGTPIALVSLIDTDRQWFKARYGLDAVQTPRSMAFCAHAILAPDKPLVVEDAHADARFVGNPLVEGAPRVVFYAGVPLRVGPDGLPLGTLCVIDHQARSIAPAALAQLRLLARQVELLLDLRLRQRQVEDRLVAVSKEEERVSAIVATMDEGLVVQVADGRIVSCNPAAERILGLTADQMMGLTSMDPRWHATRADGSPFPGAEHPAMQALASGRPVRGVIMGVGTEGGDRRWILINAQPTGSVAGGPATGVVCTFTDITALRFEEAERRRVEAHVDRFFTLSLELLCICSSDGRFLRLNPAWSRVLGWTADEMLHQPFLRFVHPDDQASTVAEAARIAPGGVTIGFENRYRCKNGGYRIFNWVSAGDGDVLLAVARDVTDERARRDELVRARDAAEAAGRAKSEFLATMSHEIRTPMNGVLGLSEVLMETPLDDQQRDKVQSIRDSGKALLAILNDILDWSRIEAGRLALESHPVDPRAVLADVTMVLSSQAAAKDLVLAMGTCHQGMVMGDAGRIRQVLFNLIGNAVKFTLRGEVRVAFARLPPGPGQAQGIGRFTIQDTGIGIPADRLDQLFQRFTQVDASTTRRFGGSGLGLAISRQLAELMGGTITATSVLGAGSTFTFDVPLAAAELAAAATAAASPRLPSRQLRILLAEDNQVNQRVAVALLKQAGHAIEVVEDGAAAVAAQARGGWDVVLMDVQMPVMDGLEAARAIRASGSTVPIIALTASAMPEERSACAAAGMDEVVAKPVTREALSEVLARWSA
jgi:PAS domain S-box-containing protein